MTSTNSRAGLDLTAARAERAAKNEARGEGLPITLDGHTLAVLPPELPLDVFSPIKTLDAEITLLMRSAVQAARAQNATEQRWDAAELMIDLLAANPALPTALLDVLAQMVKNLAGDAGYEALVAARLSREDLVYLAKGIGEFYGISLGESSPPSDSPEGDGTTLPGTSSDTSDSTSEGSGSDQATPGSSEFGTS